VVTLKSALEILQKKPTLGEYGPITRPFVILDIDEYESIVHALEAKTRQKRVPREARRETAAV